MTFPPTIVILKSKATKNPFSTRAVRILRYAQNDILLDKLDDFTWIGYDYYQ